MQGTKATDIKKKINIKMMRCSMFAMQSFLYKSRDECHRINKGSFAAISADDDSRGT